MEDGACGRGNYADTGWKSRQSAFTGLVKEAVGGELLFEALELGLARADTGGLHKVDDKLDVAALLVERDVAVGEHLGAVFDYRTPEVVQAYRNGVIDVVAVTLDEALRIAELEEEQRIVLVIDFSKGGDSIMGRKGEEGRRKEEDIARPASTSMYSVSADSGVMLRWTQHERV